MKKTLLLTLMAIIGMGTVYAQKIKLITPNGGEELVSGTPLNIAWTYTGLTGNESVSIALEGKADYGAIAFAKVSQGSLEWLAGQKMDGTFAKPAGGYRILIELQENDSVLDVSDATFTLTAPLSVVALMTPNGSETLVSGSQYDVKWSCANKTGYITLNLIRDEKLLGPIAQNLPAASLHYNWLIGAPLLNQASCGLGANYRIQVLWHAKPIMDKEIKGNDPLLKNSDKSDGVFVIISRNMREHSKDPVTNKVE